MSLFMLHLFMCQKKKKKTKVKSASKGIKCIVISYNEETKGYRLYNFVSQYAIINHDVIFDGSKIFNRQIIVSSSNFGLKHMVFN
jgi:hypothetical protein